MEWIMDPTIWIGLSTLVVLEIVLGIDNIVFIAILAEKLPPQQRDKARVTGLAFALITRVLLLMFTGWLVTLTTPLFSIFGINFNARQLIMLIGGVFLLFKATMELNERLEGSSHEDGKPKKTSHFWTVVAQIVVLDAVFSLDSVITAVGMVEHIPVMIIAVCIAIGIMMVASKPLANFVNAHPTIVILCLSFLLMIGFSLVAEGFDFMIPKGYLYAAIGFSIMIEFFNQLAIFNRRKALNKKPLRERTAEAILHLLKGDAEEDPDSHTTDVASDTHKKAPVFNHQELSMVERVLGLAQRSVSSIMTSRLDVDMVNINDDRDAIIKEIFDNPHSRLVVTDNDSIDEPLGIIQVNDLLKDVLQSEAPIDIHSLIKQPLIFPETVSLLVALEQFKKAKTHFAFVVDEFGSMQGVVSVTDIIETIAGDFPTEEEEIDAKHDIQCLGDNSWMANGYIPVEELVRFVPIALDDKREYHTLAGLLMEKAQHLLNVGETLQIGDYLFEVAEIESHRILKVKITLNKLDSVTL
ncbi:TerC family protein [Gilliamella sp. ESL0250]|uniref:TerC family protein n=1 Tax=Gilliamella sp. ESL0250 TaxID=2705036 RepID=UPI001580BEA3|nr:TerC family protein [Gilliamella sp. ESL0250]